MDQHDRCSSNECLFGWFLFFQDDGDEEFEEVEVDVKYKTVKTLDWDRVNANVAVWARDKDDVTDEEYQNFYRVRCRPYFQVVHADLSLVPPHSLSCARPARSLCRVL